jgi:TIR domain-containing protein
MADFITTLRDQLRSWGNRDHPSIFISYRRRGDGAGYGGRIADKLVEHFGVEQCFRDVDDIESGVDFVKTIQEAVGACEVLIAVIGPDWITQTDVRGKRRLDDPKDFVRLEVAAALQRDIRVIPVLVGGADIPTEHELPDVLSALSRRQVHELTDTRWEYDVTKLIAAIESIGIKAHSRSKRGLAIGPKWKTAAAVSAFGTLSLVLASVLVSGGASFFDQRDARTTESKAGKGVNAQVAPAVDTMRTSQDISQLKQALERERRDLETDLERVQKERRVEVEPSKGQLASQQSQVDSSSGIHGRVRVTWQHEGVIYSALVVMNGARGSALVNYIEPQTGIQVGAEQDLEFIRNANGAFYVGSNSRVPGTAIPHPFYAPDIFRLTRLRDGNWAIAEVSPDWHHFDRVVTSQ